MLRYTPLFLENYKCLNVMHLNGKCYASIWLGELKVSTLYRCYAYWGKLLCLSPVNVTHLSGKCHLYIPYPQKGMCIEAFPTKQFNLQRGRGKVPSGRQITQ